MWDRDADRLALLELLTTGSLRRRTTQSAAFDHLATLSWTRNPGRRDELALVPERRADLVDLLHRVWPTWHKAHLDLVVAGVPPTPKGWSHLTDLRRAETIPALPDRINRRTAASLTAPGAKSTLTEARRTALGDREVTDDGVVRLRPPLGLVARRGAHHLRIDDVLETLDEIGVSDRALRDGLELRGQVDAVLLVENLGAWRDMPRPGSWLLAHVPGWNTATVRGLLAALPPAPVLHFGDLDPNGVRIHLHLRGQVEGLRWFIPAFWSELVATHAQHREWPLDLPLDDAPDWVRQLARDGLWLEQEPVAMDPRLPGALADALLLGDPTSARA